MRLSSLNPQVLHLDGKTGLAFLCPCCKKEYLCCFFQETPMVDQRAMMSNIVNVDAASWVPSSSILAYAEVNFHNFERVTIRPGIDASAAGHWKGLISDGECITAESDEAED